MPTKDKEKQKLWAAAHYKKNKQKVINRARICNRISIDRNIKYIKNYLSSHPCVDCGNNNIIVLEFDHVRGKKRSEISLMTRAAYSIKTIQTEIDKCEVRCANCHRIVTYNRRVLPVGFEPTCNQTTVPTAYKAEPIQENL